LLTKTKTKINSVTKISQSVNEFDKSCYTKAVIECQASTRFSYAEQAFKA